MSKLERSPIPKLRFSDAQCSHNSWVVCAILRARSISATVLCAVLAEIPTRRYPMKCPYCRRPVIKIDYYGEALIGCIDCNRWGRPGDKTLVLELLEDDLQALRATRRRQK